MPSPCQPVGYLEVHPSILALDPTVSGPPARAIGFRRVSRRQTYAVASIALVTAVAGVMHYAGASAVATFVVAGV